MENLSIIDVTDFFDKIIKGYTRFAQSASDLASEIPSLSPDRIQNRCQELNCERKLLSQLDEQLLDIINIAHEDLVTSRYIAQYRNAFSSATNAIDDIQKQLQIAKDALETVTHH